METMYKIILKLALIIFAFNGVSQTPAIKLKISQKNFSDETVIRFMEGATESIDNQKDAIKLFSANKNVPSIFTMKDSLTPLVISTYPNLGSIKQSASVLVRVANSGDYTLSSFLYGSIDSMSCIKLEDLKTGLIYDLLAQSSFTINIDESSIPVLRFKIHFSGSAEVIVKNLTCDFNNNGEINITLPKETNWSCNLFNSAGNLVDSSYVNAENISFKNLSVGQYQVVSTTYYGCQETKSLVVASDFRPMQLNVNNILCKDELGALELEKSGETNWSYSIMDSEGKSIHAHTNKSNNAYINNLPVGAYIVDLSTSSGCFERDTIHIKSLYSPTQIMSENTSEYGRKDGRMVLTKTGIINWTYILLDEKENIMKVGCNIDESDSVIGLHKGEYKVISITNYGCLDTNLVTIHADASTSIQDEMDNVGNVSLFNSLEGLSLNANFTIPTSIEVNYWDMSGRNIQAFSYSNLTSNRIDLPNNSNSGAYIVVVSSKDKILKKQLVLTQ